MLDDGQDCPDIQPQPAEHRGGPRLSGPRTPGVRAGTEFPDGTENPNGTQNASGAVPSGGEEAAGTAAPLGRPGCTTAPPAGGATTGPAGGEPAHPGGTEARDTARRSLEEWVAARSGEPLAELHDWTLLPPGKLLRPVLVLESAAAVGGRTAPVEPVAAGFELMHAGSLVHDDIVDGDEVRRGRAATHCRFGVERAIVGADALFFAVFETLGECRARGVPDRRIADATAVIAQAGLDITRGVTLELELSGGHHDDTESYLEMARLKTAALLRAACRTGAVLAGGSAEQADALTEFGETLGIAFQIQDDLLPYTSSPAPPARSAPPDGAVATGAVGASGAHGRAVTAGKCRTSDLRNGRPVLPVLLARRLGDAADRALLAELLDPAGAGAGGADEESRQERLHELMDRTGALAAAQATAETCLNRCRRALDVLPPSPHRRRLAALAGMFGTSGRPVGAPVGDPPEVVVPGQAGEPAAAQAGGRGVVA